MNGPPPLERLYLYLTAGCNQACRHCWLAPRFVGERSPDAAACGALDSALVTRALDEASALGLGGVKLTGGEPLLHPDFPAILDEVLGRGLEVAIETNGTLVTAALARRLAVARGARVAVSLDAADAAVHDAVRGRAGAFEASCRAVRTLVSEGVRPQVVMTVMRANVGQVEPLIGLATRLGAASVKFNVLQPTARGERLHQGEEAVPVADLIALGRRVDAVLSQEAGIPLSFDHPWAFRSLERIAAGKDGGRCGVLGILGVTPSGAWALCGIGEQVSGLAFGRVAEDPLAKVWREHPTLIALREGLPERLRGVCGRCVMREVCLGSCIAQTMYRTGSPFEPFWFCQAAFEAGSFPVSRLEPARGTIEPGGVG